MLLWPVSSRPGSVEGDELGFTALCWWPLCRRLLGHGGLLLGRATGGRHLLIQGLLPREVGLLRGRQRRILAGEGGHEILHAVGLVAHGHRLTPHVSHGAGLWRLGDGWQALWGLGGHILVALGSSRLVG